MIQEYQLNTGVKPREFDPPAGMALMKGFRDSGNGVFVIPFKCEEVPEGYKPIMACDTLNYPKMDEFIVREVEKDSTILKSKYVYFVKT